jgi:chitinase
VTPTITGDWGSGFGANIAIKNTSSNAVTDWRLRFDLSRPARPGDPGGTPKIDSIWNVEVLSVQGTTVTVGPLSWNRQIAPGAKVEFGFNGSPGGVSISNAIFLPSGTSPGPTPSPGSPSPTPSPTPDPSPSPPPVGGAGPGLVAYFAEWGIYERNYNVTDIPANSVNVINYAFAKIENGEVALFDSYAAVDKAFPGDNWDQPLRGNFHQLAKLKAQHPHLKVMISVGGWTLSAPFSDAALTQASREKLARSAVAFIKRFGFDGVDVDWEYPVGGGLQSGRAADKANYTLLLQELRRQLDIEGALDGKRYLLSIAAPAGADKIANLELFKIGQTVDWINVMTYDYHGGWENVTNHHAPLWHNPQDPSSAALGYNVDASIQAYLHAGVPAPKVVLGIPAYGQSWSGASGLFQAASGRGPGSWEAGIFDYKDLVARKTQQPSLYQRIWDAAALAPVLVAPSLNGLVVSYEDEQSLGAKIAYARDNKLGGFLLWELSGDVSSSRPESLVAAMARALRSWPTP